MAEENACCFIIPTYVHEQRLRRLQRSTPAGISTVAGGAQVDEAREREIERLQRAINFDLGIRAIVRQRTVPPIRTPEYASAAAGFAFASTNAPAPVFSESYGDMGTCLDDRYTSPDEIRPTDCIKQLPGQVVQSSYDATTQEVSQNTKIVWSFYNEVFGRNSIDGRGMTLTSSVHYGKDYANAFWLDVPEDNVSQMVYGDGDQTFNHLTGAVDVIGHEMTHGVINRTCDLRYRNESGALNESCADVFGVCIKQWHLKQNVSEANWLIGEGTIQGSSFPHPALRRFDDQQAFEDDIQPKTVAGMQKMQSDPQYAVTLQRDQGGVHIFSGIPNRAFYTFAKSLGDNTKSWEAPLKVWYQVLTDRVNSIPQTATFKQFAAATISHALPEHQKLLQAAWNTVGVIV